MADRTLHVDVRVDRDGRDGGFTLAVAFDVPPGITILFGPSGSGKTTVLQLIAGLLRPAAGRVALGSEIWCDASVGRHRAVHRRRVAYLFQSLALFPHLSAARNVAYGIDPGLPRADRLARARDMLRRVGVAHLADRRPATFSGGEAQRVALARALAISPRILLLDEPFSALDRPLRVQLATLVHQLVAELAIPAIHVTHHHGEVRALGDRIVRLHCGRVAEVGSIDQVLGPRAGDHAADELDASPTSRRPAARRGRAR